VFEVLMDAVRVCSSGQITNCLFEVRGQYRRNRQFNETALSRCF
jgi:methylmalonyl-CoA mutase